MLTEEDHLKTCPRSHLKREGDCGLEVTVISFRECWQGSEREWILVYLESECLF